jgi:putative ABC transport system permease protein
MRVWAKLWMRFTMLFHRKREAERLEAELQFHLEQQIAENVAFGMAPDEARRAALRLFGNPTLLREQAQELWSWNWLEHLIQDVRHALRQLRRNPELALTAVLSLTLGIGATISVFSIGYDALINPWPYAQANRMYGVSVLAKTGENVGFGLTAAQIELLRHASAIEDVTVSQGGRQLSITGRDFPEDVKGGYFTSNSFQFLGLPAMLGRYFTPSDVSDDRDPNPVVVLSSKFWKQHFKGDPSIVGKTIEISHQSYTILGVMPPRFTWGAVDVYLPLEHNSKESFYSAVFKLKPGVSQSAAAAEILPFSRPKDLPKDYKLELHNISYFYIQQLGPTLGLLFGAVSLLLAIGCGNLSILLLARGTVREHEFAIRSAVGASISRIVRQLLTESLILALFGTAMGILLAYSTLHFIVPWLPPGSFPDEVSFNINIPVLLFSGGLAVLTGVTFGLLPALKLSNPAIGRIMQSSTRRFAGSLGGKYMHNALIAGQIAMTMLLLTAAGLTIESFLHLTRMPLGYEPHNVMAVGIPIHEGAFTTWEARMNYFEQLREKIAELPDVISTGVSTNGTPPEDGWEQTVEFLGKSFSETQKVNINFVDPGYFNTLLIPLRQGRMWDHTEITHGAQLALVNESFAKRYFSDGDVLEHSLRIPELKGDPVYVVNCPGGSNSWLQIIGVASDSINDGLDKPVKPAIYIPYSLWMPMGTQFLVRFRANPLSIEKNIKRQVASINPEQQVTLWHDGLLDLMLKNEPIWATERLISILLAAYSFLALALASVGLYSVVSYSVTQRTNEFGIRLALGARKIDVLKLVFASAGVSVGLGVGIGFVLSFGLNRLLVRWVASSRHDPLMVLGGVLLLLLTAVLACLGPARKACDVDPMESLRCE